MTNSAHVLFISDLHLSQNTTSTTRLFEKFIEQYAPAADTVYILGDFFEYWAGDDDCDSDDYHRHIISLLAGLKQKQTKLFIMHGNRDLLFGQTFAERCNATLLPDPTLINLFGQATLLTHGDALCTDDVAYQQFRSMVRSEAFQQQFLAKPLAERKAFIQQLRSQSKQQNQLKSEEIMDVNKDAVTELFRSHNYPTIIHGHTHRPKCHDHLIDEHLCKRWVLSDWHETGNMLKCDHHSWQALEITND